MLSVGDVLRRCAFLMQLNLKFEIEVLCKNLSLDINDLKPGNLLKDKDKLKNLEEQLSAPKKESKAPEETLAVSTAGGRRLAGQVQPLSGRVGPGLASYFPPSDLVLRGKSSHE